MREVHAARDGHGQQDGGLLGSVQLDPDSNNQRDQQHASDGVTTQAGGTHSPNQGDEQQQLVRRLLHEFKLHQLVGQLHAHSCLADQERHDIGPADERQDVPIQVVEFFLRHEPAPEHDYDNAQGQARRVANYRLQLRCVNSDAQDGQEADAHEDEVPICQLHMLSGQHPLLLLPSLVARQAAAARVVDELQEGPSDGHKYHHHGHRNADPCIEADLVVEVAQQADGDQVHGTRDRQQR
mmetsp:Transcript_115236/g.332878  ORF Transcript_115236/g.332878 Transcript_115236/m.332878 type:complete len:239 (+) Transcript_115236:374-1090(+)